MSRQEGKNSNLSSSNDHDSSRKKRSKETNVVRKKFEKKAKTTECVDNLVVLNKIQGALLTHLKADLEEINCT